MQQCVQSNFLNAPYSSRCKYMYEITSLQNQCIFYKLENAEKNICWRIHLSAVPHLQKALITTSWENLPLIGENIVFSNMPIFEKIHITENNFGKYLEPLKELNKICMVKTTAKMLDWCYIWSFIVIFMD